MPKRTPRFIFVMGGVISGLGKGVAVSSMAMLLQQKGYRVTAMKIDPYVNVDAGTMNPTEHGEVFVTKDGLETDQDIGNYERFLNTELTRSNYMTTGAVYLSLIEAERNLQFSGKCVEVVPHVPNEVIRRIRLCAQQTRSEIVIIEVGGTVGEYQNLLFLEAARMMHLKEPENVQFVLVSYLPIPSNLGEMKTKPTQYAVRTLNSAGIQPDIVLARASQALDAPRRARIAENTGVDEVISAPDVASIYEVPLNFEREKLADTLLANFGLRARRTDLRRWRTLVRRVYRPRRQVRIGIAGKYFGTGDFTLLDSYISVIEAVKHAAWSLRAKPEVVWLNAEAYEQAPAQLKELQRLDGLIIPGGFGSRGIEGKIKAIQYARTHALPFFGLCYGMQLAVVEFARNVLKFRDADTTEVNPATTHPVIDILPEQREKLARRDYGGSMRLGAYPCTLKRGSVAQAAYGAATVSERHRHRYEVNNVYRARLEKAGLRVSGVFKTRDLAEIIELPEHPFFLGTQFHPEFLSRPLTAHPLFRAFVAAGLTRQRQRASATAE
ncbi:MAG: CTP synthase [Candidatus Kerfeldbacteria bacterium]|nr:CTP synthase [Candidatus Kerfeldbacteria bacterium]